VYRRAGCRRDRDARLHPNAPDVFGGDAARSETALLGDALLKARTRDSRAQWGPWSNTVPLVHPIAIRGRHAEHKMIAAAMSGVAPGVKRGEGIAGAAA